MTDKEKFFKDYKEAVERFNKTVIPDENTPKPLAAIAEGIYNSRLKWLKEAENYAESRGWYKELTANK